MLFDHLVVLLSVFPGRMASEVHIPGAHFVAIIGYLRGNLVLVSAISFPASLLGGRLQSEMLYSCAYVAESLSPLQGMVARSEQSTKRVWDLVSKSKTQFLSYLIKIT